MSFQRYAQFGPVAASPAQPPQAASYGAFMMQMLPMMMQQARTQQQPLGPTPEQQAGVGMSPLGNPPGQPDYPQPGPAMQQAPPVPVPADAGPVSPDPSYQRGAYLALMREGLGR